MGLLNILKVQYDPLTGELSFCVRAVFGTCPVTIVSSIRLPERPRSLTALRWAIVARSHELLAV